MLRNSLLMTDDRSDNLRFLPVGLDVRGKDCFVVGGGSVGTRKVHTLARAGAAVTVISPTVTEELAAEIDAGRVRWVKDSYQESHFGDAFLVIAATDDAELNATIIQAAAKRGALVCDASSADRSQVIFGALHTGEDATIAVFTDGRDPANARDTRDRIADFLDADYPPEDEP
jgi:siroheme synthase-like protein